MKILIEILNGKVLDIYTVDSVDQGDELMFLLLRNHYGNEAKSVDDQYEKLFAYNEGNYHIYFSELKNGMESIKRLKGETDLEHISIIWSVDDVLMLSEDIKIPIDRETARRLLFRLKREHDPTVGINMETIKAGIKKERQITKP